MVSLRGHHLICLRFFQGGGYSREFIDHLFKVIEGARSGGGEVAFGSDDVCVACPYVDGKICARGENTEEQVRRMDEEALALLGYAKGDSWTWDELGERIPSIFPSWFADQCLGCEWRGSCEQDGLFRRLRRGIHAESGFPVDSDPGGERPQTVPFAGSALEEAGPILFSRGTLWRKVIDRTQHALRAGALIPIPTQFRFIEDAGVRFVVRVVSSLLRKDEARREEEVSPRGEALQNPFLPYERELFVADVSASHVALLNKFNVVDHHLLIVTREFEDQETLLTPGDFQALWACMGEYESLGFYNGGSEAGASQRHRHLQMVPLPIAPSGPTVPIEPLLDTEVLEYSLFAQLPLLPFLHSYIRFDNHGERRMDDPLKAFKLYCGMLEAVGIIPPVPGRLVRQSAPYCLLVTRRWMLLVPRSREYYGSISINSLGFAGAMLVRTDEDMEVLATQGPMTVLKAVSLPLRAKGAK